MLGRPTKSDIAGFRSSIAEDMLTLLPPAGQPKSFTTLFAEASAAEVDLLRQCFVIHPKKRISSRAITRHPLVASLHVPQYSETAAKVPFTVHEPLDVKEARMLLLGLRKELGGVLP
jgi:serine/threonine protein kinase